MFGAKYISNHKEIQAIEVQLNADADISCIRLVVLANVSNSLNLVGTPQLFSNASEFREALNLKKACLLCISGDVVITKHLDRVEANTELVSAEHIMPGVNNNEFVVDEYVFEQQGWFSLTRETIIKELVVQLDLPFLIGIRIGPQVISKEILDLLGYSNGFTTSSFGILIHEEKYGITSEATTNVGNIHFGTTTLNADFGLALATAINYLVFYQKGLNLSITVANLESYTYHILLHKALKFGVILCLVVGLVGFVSGEIIHNSYSEEVMRSEERKVLLQQINSVTEELKENERTLSAFNAFDTIPMAYYMDEIGSTVLEDIVLTRLDFNPLGKKIRKDEPIDLKYKEVNIEGQTSFHQALRTWSDRLNMLPWVRNVEVIKLEKPNGKPMIFKLKLTIE